MGYLGWFDPDRKRTITQKILAALDRHEQKFGTRPTVALVNPIDAQTVGEIPGVTIEARTYIARHTVYVGLE